LAKLAIKVYLAIKDAEGVIPAPAAAVFGRIAARMRARRRRYRSGRKAYCAIIRGREDRAIRVPPTLVGFTFPMMACAIIDVDMGRIEMMLKGLRRCVRNEAICDDNAGLIPVPLS
jgi:hypothetical protein